MDEAKLKFCKSGTKPGHIHLFITLLKRGGRKKGIERKLTEIRLKQR